MTTTAAGYLRQKEWSMGNGQCPECCGVSQEWHGHPLHLTTEDIGHKANCRLAAALRCVGETPLMIGEFVSDREFECFITGDGFLGTRPKTEEGCPKYRAYVDNIGRMIDEVMFAALTGGTVRK